MMQEDRHSLVPSGRHAPAGVRSAATGCYDHHAGACLLDEELGVRELETAFGRLLVRAGTESRDDWVDYYRGRLAQLRGEHVEALQYLEACLHQAPDHVFAEYFRGVSAFVLGEAERACRIFARVAQKIDLTEGLADGAMRCLRTRAKFNHGVVLMELESPVEAAEVFEGLLGERMRWSDPHATGGGKGSVPAWLGRTEALARFHLGLALADSGQEARALEQYDIMVNEYGAHCDARLRDVAARALFNSSVLKARNAPPEEAAGYFAEVAKRIGTDDSPVIMEQAAKALVNQSLAELDAGRCEQALQTCETMLERFESVRGPLLAEKIAAAMVNRGVALETLTRLEEAARAFEGVLTRFSGNPDPSLRMLVIRAQFNRGVVVARLMEEGGIGNGMAGF